jgi:predicted transposase YdaD
VGEGEKNIGEKSPNYVVIHMIISFQREKKKKAQIPSIEEKGSRGERERGRRRGRGKREGKKGKKKKELKTFFVL